MDAAAGASPALAYPIGMEPAVRSPLRELTSALARGDDAAWSEFHRDYGPILFRQLLAATRGNHELASDALQQAYLRVARHARPCEEEAMFRTWLRIVGRSALNDCLRRRRTFWDMLRRQQEEPRPGDDRDPLAEQRLEAALDRALEMLPAEDRALLEMKYFGGADVRTIASRLEISPKAAESRLTRARAGLRAQLLSRLNHDETEA